MTYLVLILVLHSAVFFHNGVGESNSQNTYNIKTIRALYDKSYYSKSHGLEDKYFDFSFNKGGLYLPENPNKDITNLQQEIYNRNTEAKIYGSAGRVCDCLNEKKCYLVKPRLFSCGCYFESNRLSMLFCEGCNCSSGSRCRFETLDSRTCDCLPGYRMSHKNCTTTPCSFKPCKNGGECTDSGNTFTCKCLPSYYGDTCELGGPCEPNPCKDNGTCSLFFSKVLCIWKEGDAYKICDEEKCVIMKDHCMPNPCKNNGECKATETDFSCTCSPLWKGETCEKKACICNGGVCVEEDDKLVCRCPPGFGNFTANSCRACDCGPDINCMWQPRLSAKVCFCKPGYYEKMGKCVDCECGPDSNCSLISEGWLKPGKKVCHCKPGYVEENGKCVSPCSNPPCQNNGTCIESGQSFTCECKSPFRGRNCEIGPCTSNPCKNNGECKVDGQGYTCDCKTPYKGNTCETDPCTDNPCKHGGTCNLLGSSFKCDCKNPYYGDKCEKDPCTELPCKNGGICELHSNSFKCICKNPYYGDKCENDPCTYNPCRNGGTCRLHGNYIKCDCKQPFSGYLCENDVSYSKTIKTFN